jgi:hypothetical protein
MGDEALAVGFKAGAETYLRQQRAARRVPAACMTISPDSRITPSVQGFRLSGAAARSLVVFSRRAAASQELAIQVGTPNRGRTHFITTKYPSRTIA